jgi:hypothetical protein
MHISEPLVASVTRRAMKPIVVITVGCHFYQLRIKFYSVPFLKVKCIYILLLLLLLIISNNTIYIWCYLR